MTSTEWLYERTDDDSARFVLGTVGRHPLICVGVNPSTAAPGALDATLTRVQAVAGRHGYDSFVMLNLYPLRSTDPKGLPRQPDAGLTELNRRHILRVLDRDDAAVWAAWGTLIATRRYLAEALHGLLEQPLIADARWMSRGPISRDGHPHHPLYVRDAEPLVPFDIRRYRDAIG